VNKKPTVVFWRALFFRWNAILAIPLAILTLAGWSLFSLTRSIAIVALVAIVVLFFSGIPSSLGEVLKSRDDEVSGQQEEIAELKTEVVRLRAFDEERLVVVKEKLRTLQPRDRDLLRYLMHYGGSAIL